MSRLACLGIAVAVAVALPGGARAAPPEDRVVLADPDPELLRAVQSALAPWRLEVVVEEGPPTDEAAAEARARARTARFVVWRREGALVVFDRDRGAIEERASAAGPLDAVDAAAAALTVKTLMRLPPPPPPPEEPPPIGPPIARPGLAVRAQAALAVRIARGSTTEVGGRLVAAALVRPLPRLAWRIGAAVDLGSPARVQHAGFQGTWTDWAVLALASWTFHRAAWEIEPQLGAGVTRSALDGTQMFSDRRERATLGLLRGGVTMRRRAGRWTFGGTVGADWIPGTPTYTRAGTSARIFEVPGVAAVLGVLAAADFGGVR